MTQTKHNIYMPEQSTSFTKDYLGLKVLDKSGETIGQVADLAIRMGEEFPTVSAIITAVSVRVSLFGKAKFEAVIPWRTVKKCGEDGIALRIEFSELKTGKLGQDELLLKKHVMDQQIVDNEGRKILRVNDVKLRTMHEHIRLVGVEAGIKGLLYRLGAGRRLERVANLLNVKIMENIIMWDLVEQFDSEMKRIKLSISQEMLKDLINI
jgi:magnesium transporter